MPRTGIRNDDEYDYDRVDEHKLRVMKRLRDSVSNWQNEWDRLELLCRLSDLFKEWKLHLPRLEDTFEPRQMDFLIADSIDNLRFENWSSQPGRRFLDFLELTGYRDAPELDELGRPNLRRDTAVFWAVRTENYNMARELFRIYNSYDSNYYDETGLTHFHVACRYGVVRAVQGFLEAGQDPNCPSPIVVNAAPGQQQGSSIESPLHEALRARKSDIIRLLINYGASPNVRNVNGLTALHVLSMQESIVGDELEMVREFFIRRRRSTLEKTDIDCRDAFGNTPLHWAIAKGHDDLARLLIVLNADTNAINNIGITILHTVCAAGNLKMTKDILQFSKKNINKAHVKNNCPLHIAIQNNSDEKLIRLLIANGADSNKPGKHKLRPLHLCCQLDSDEPELVELLVNAAKQNGQVLELSAKDECGRTPLHMAVARSHDKTAKLLLSLGANPIVADKEGVIPLHLVCKFGRSSCYGMAEALLKSSQLKGGQAVIHARDHAGRTPLEYALVNLRVRLVDLLLDHGASLDFPSADHFDEVASGGQQRLGRSDQAALGHPPRDRRPAPEEEAGLRADPRPRHDDHANIPRPRPVPEPGRSRRSLAEKLEVRERSQADRVEGQAVALGSGADGSRGSDEATRLHGLHRAAALGQAEEEDRRGVPRAVLRAPLRDNFEEILHSGEPGFLHAAGARQGVARDRRYDHPTPYEQ